MKLYYAPGACSLASHIALREAGLPVELVKVDLGSKRTETGVDFRTVNSKGYVPTVELDDGQRLTEGPAILQYIADKVPTRGLAPSPGTMERYRLQEWLNFISTELHKQYSPLFDRQADEAVKQRQRERLAERLGWVSRQLGERDYLMGSNFSVADAYLFTVLSWSGLVGVDLSGLAALTAFVARVGAREAVQAALRAEGLLKA